MLTRSPVGSDNNSTVPVFESDTPATSSARPTNSGRPEQGEQTSWSQRLTGLSSRAPQKRLLRGESSVIDRTYRLIDRVAPSLTHVLITGESGVGKELVAREIHAASDRADGPLVTVNCAAIPEALLESELFGHKKGAFTNATCDRQGRFKQAEGGTIFLDEIGEMRLDLQAKLLRVLQEHEFQPVGSNETVHGDFRVVAATNQNLEELVEAGKFRADLYYRLSVFPISVAALRRRPGDIPVLIEHFVREFNTERDTSIDAIAPEVVHLMMDYQWPGNVRELKNVVERMMILRGEGRIEVEDLPERVQSGRPLLAFNPEAEQLPEPVPVAPDMGVFPEEGVDLRAELQMMEIRLIRGALERTKGNKNQAAQLLKINRTTLVEKCKRLNIEV